MATRPTETVDTNGLIATYNAASGGGDKVVPGAHVGIHVMNDSVGTDCDVTLVTPGTVDGNLVADRVVTVAFGTAQFIAVPDIYRNPSDGLASITWEAATDMTFAVIRIN